MKDIINLAINVLFIPLPMPINDFTILHYSLFILGVINFIFWLMIVIMKYLVDQGSETGGKKQ